MLLELDIRDLAVAEQIHVEFTRGFTAITGETGAGKSIILDALDFLLGGKPDATLIRSGAASARVEAVFELAPGPEADAVGNALTKAGIELDDGTLIISREIAAGDRLRTAARVNGKAVVQPLLLALRGHLVDIHGQTDQMTLLQPAEHIHYLDRFAVTGALRGEFAASADRLRRVRGELSRMLTDERERARRRDRLAYECAEIDAAELRPDEESDLLAERQLLANAEQIVELAESALSVLNGDSRRGGAVDALGNAADVFAQLAQLDPRLAEDTVSAQALQEQAADLGRSLRVYRENVEYNPERLVAIEERLSLFASLKRKYGLTIAEVLSYADHSRGELAELDSSEERRAELEAEEPGLRSELGERATAVSVAREVAARRLVAAITVQLADLRMDGARFGVSLTRRADPAGIAVRLVPALVVSSTQEELPLPLEGAVAFDRDGVDRVEFLVTLNPGAPLLPLARVASGGETSRLMLAFKSALGEVDAVPTLVFDEIEAGLGGRSGGVVAEKLSALAEHHQVICITHLPQVAAPAERHLNVVKSVDGGRTRVTVRALERGERVYELAAMLGAVTPATLASARELLDDADERSGGRKVRAG